MSEPIQTPQPEAIPTPVTQEPAQAETDWKTESRKWEQRAKDNLAQVQELKPRADQFAALEEASKTEAQRLADAASTAQAALATAQAEAVRYKVAATHGIPAEHFDLLGSGSEEEVTTRAEKLAALLAAQVAPVTPPPAQPVTPGRRPVEQMRPGASPAGSETAEDVDYARLFGTG